MMRHTRTATSLRTDVPRSSMGRRRVRHAGASVRAALLALLACGAVAFAAGCSGQGGSDDGGSRIGRSPGALAQVNRAVLREEELRQLVPMDLSESVTGVEIREILDHWVTTELLYQKAVQDGLDRDPEVAEVLHQMQRQLLADEYMQRELRNRVQLTNDEIRKYYDEHSDQYTQEVHLRHIVLNSVEDAQVVLEELRGGGDFRALAKKHSVDPSAGDGGDLGYLAKGAMNPAFEPAVFEMAPNEVRGPIASSFGFHIVQVVRRRKAAEPVTFEVARDEILQALLLEEKQRVERELLMDLHRRATVHVARSYAGMLLESEDSAPPDPEGATDAGDTAAEEETSGTP